LESKLKNYNIIHNHTAEGCRTLWSHSREKKSKLFAWNSLSQK